MCSQLEIDPVVIFFCVVFCRLVFVLFLLAIVMKKIEYTKGSSEAVKRTKTENTIIKRTCNDLQKHRKLKIKDRATRISLKPGITRVLRNSYQFLLH